MKLITKQKEMANLSNELITMNSLCNGQGSTFYEKTRIKKKSKVHVTGEQVQGQILDTFISEYLLKEWYPQSLRMDQLSAEIFKGNDKLRTGRALKLQFCKDHF